MDTTLRFSCPEKLGATVLEPPAPLHYASLQRSLNVCRARVWPLSLEGWPLRAGTVPCVSSVWPSLHPLAQYVILQWEFAVFRNSSAPSTRSSTHTSCKLIPQRKLKRWLRCQETLTEPLFYSFSSCYCPDRDTPNHPGTRGGNPRVCLQSP